MAQITISLPEDLAEKVKYFAESHGYATVSDFIREALREKIGDTRKMHFWERALMVRVLEMYNRIMKDDGPNSYDVSSSIDALQFGYAPDYIRSFQDVDQNELSQEVARFVHDVFSCYDDLQISAKVFNDEELSRKVLFSGYDGNNESEYLGFAGYLRKTERYTFIQVSGSDLNSHCPMLGIYRRMLHKWREIRSSKPDLIVKLERSEIESVIAARKSSSN